MAVEWVDPDTFEAVVGEMPTVAQFNSVLQDLKYLSDPPRCAVRLTSDQAVADATDHAIDFDEAVWDSHADMWDIGAPSRVTITRDGLYSITLSTVWESTDGAERAADLEVNGVHRRDFFTVSANDIAEFASSNTIVTNLEDGDYIEALVRQESGVAQDLISTRTVMTVVWIALPPASGE